LAISVETGIARRFRIGDPFGRERRRRCRRKRRCSGDAAVNPFGCKFAWGEPRPSGSLISISSHAVVAIDQSASDPNDVTNAFWPMHTWIAEGVIAVDVERRGPELPSNVAALDPALASTCPCEVDPRSLPS
jgi:hypothetical protein